MYLVIEQTTYETVTDLYIVKSQDESFSNAQKKKEALELLNKKKTHIIRCVRCLLNYKKQVSATQCTMAT